jgi:hypothetical protein
MIRPNRAVIIVQKYMDRALLIERKLKELLSTPEVQSSVHLWDWPGQAIEHAEQLPAETNLLVLTGSVFGGFFTPTDETPGFNPELDTEKGWSGGLVARAIKHVHPNSQVLLFSTTSPYNGDGLDYAEIGCKANHDDVERAEHAANFIARWLQAENIWEEITPAEQTAIA